MLSSTSLLAFYYMLVRKGGFEPPRLTAPPPQDGASASSATSARGEVKNSLLHFEESAFGFLSVQTYFDGAGAGVAGAGAAGAGADAGATGDGTAGADFGVFENCCNTELPKGAAVEFWCMVNAMDVSMNMMAHHVVAFERNVAAPRGPNAVWLPAPPNAPAKSAASPLCSMITMIKRPQIITCNVTKTK